MNNLGMYSYIQQELGNIGRFSKRTNTLCYIIGDKEGIIKFIQLVHGKLRTPKNIRFNQLIHFINTKYSININESLIDTSPLFKNS